MDDKLLAVLIGIVAGALGYLVVTFWVQPILKYRELRMKVFADFVFYAQVVNAEGLNERMQELYEGNSPTKAVLVEAGVTRQHVT